MSEQDRHLATRHKRLMQLPHDFEQRAGLRMLLGEELYGEPLGANRHAEYATGTTLFDPTHRTVSAGDLLGDGRDWIVIETAFGCRYLTLADQKGGFILLSLTTGFNDVLIEFEGPVDTSDRPTRRFDEMSADPVPVRDQRQYIKFLMIAADLLVAAASDQP